MSKNISYLLFDCDGVMCPPLLFAKVLKEQYAITVEMTKEFFAEAFTSALKGEADVLDILEPYLEKWGWTGSAKGFLDLWLKSESHVDRNMKRIVEDLKGRGLRVALATNQEKHRADYMRTHMGFSDLFDQLFISCELGVMKPEDSYFRKVSELLKIQPHEILFIDDQKHYTDAANKAGWRTIQFISSEKLMHQIFDFL